MRPGGKRGISQAEELFSLTDLDIVSISLNEVSPGGILRRGAGDLGRALIIRRGDAAGSPTAAFWDSGPSWFVPVRPRSHKRSPAVQGRRAPLKLHQCAGILVANFVALRLGDRRRFDPIAGLLRLLEGVVD